MYKVLKFILKPIFFIWFWPTIIGKENIPEKGRVIIAANHQYNMDPSIIIVSTKRKIHFLGKKELFDTPFKFFFKGVGVIPVDRSKKDVYAKEEAIKLLKEDEVVALFPEGTRNKTKNKLLPFKYGTVSMAQKTNSKIVPCIINGDFKPFQKNIKVEFKKPIDVSNMSYEEATNYLANEILEKVER